jgi:hypothetical protein
MCYLTRDNMYDFLSINYTVNARMSIATLAVRAIPSISLSLWSSCYSAEQMSKRLPQLEDKAGLVGLFHTSVPC